MDEKDTVSSKVSIIVRTDDMQQKPLDVCIICGQEGQYGPIEILREDFIYRACHCPNGHGWTEVTLDGSSTGAVPRWGVNWHTLYKALGIDPDS